MEKIQIILEPEDNNRLLNLCGPLNSNLKEIELRFDVEINQRGNSFNFLGVKKNIDLASNFIRNLYIETEKNSISIAELRTHLQQPKVFDKEKIIKNNQNMFFKFKNHRINIDRPNQIKFYKSILENDVVFSVGSAGSGKTFLSIGAALHCYELGLVKKIVLVRPAVEAGENLGFLPGDLSQKIDPYLRPMYDALNSIMGSNLLNKMIEQNLIEVAPLAYMRGRTLNDSFIILDEAQNSTKEQMKMFLTRLGRNSKAVITGDITQIDLPNAFSGLVHVLPLLESITDISICKFTDEDVMRHPLVKKIINAYESKSS